MTRVQIPAGALLIAMAKKKQKFDAQALIKRLKAEGFLKPGSKEKRRIKREQAGMAADSERLIRLFEKKVLDFEAREGRKATKNDRTDLAMELVREEADKKVAELEKTFAPPKGPDEINFQQEKLRRERHDWMQYYFSFFMKGGKR